MLKASLGKRFLAYLVDAVIAGVLFQVFDIFGAFAGGIGGLLGVGYLLLRDGLPVDFAEGRSVGKQLLGLRPVRADGMPMDPVASLKRNWTFLVPFLGLVEAVLVLVDKEGRRIGDRVADTTVEEE